MGNPASQSPCSPILGRSHKVMEPQFPHLPNGRESTYSVGPCGGLKEIIEVKVLWKLENIVPVEDVIFMSISSPNVSLLVEAACPATPELR